jgi:hypothetical protein
VTTLELVTLINAEDAVVPEAVRRVLPVLAEVVDIAVDRVRRGGTVHYFWAGTAGRMAVIDAGNLVLDLEDAGWARYLIRDRDGKFAAIIAKVLADAGIGLHGWRPSP